MARNPSGTGNPSGAAREPEPAPVTLDGELVARLVGALEMIGTAFTVEEVNDARTMTLISRLAAGGDGGRAADTPDPGRARAARDYDVIRGLLGRAGAPRPLKMRRTLGAAEFGAAEFGAAEFGAAEFVDPVPVAAAIVVAESPGDDRSGPLAETFEVDGLSAPTLEFSLISPAMLISRVEVLDQAGTLLAFGPSLQPIQPIA